MTSGGCLCGGVRFEIARAVGPFELCHCPRCRKASGSAFAALVGVKVADYRLPDKHIFVEGRAAWFEPGDALPRFTKAELAEWRARHARPGAGDA